MLIGLALAPPTPVAAQAGTDTLLCWPTRACEPRIGCTPVTGARATYRLHPSQLDGVDAEVMAIERMGASVEYYFVFPDRDIAKAFFAEGPTVPQELVGILIPSDHAKFQPDFEAQSVSRRFNLKYVFHDPITWISCWEEKE